MKEFLQKAMRGASVLLILYVISSCGGEKQMDSSSLLMLLGPENPLCRPKLILTKRQV
ncbi:hypothetical protein LEP1GSC024_0621 [Leptospira noguchii str. 2001034031]|uniref:Lipoprotein n=1 Tax=Leptospira noguchii str. 2001034031 TaxID=1193053 RepID=M6YBY4_9LEPT|nr:hypothetical protein LEP1GSC024_0621 [Leptospira noguchii str. 2001034031]